MAIRKNVGTACARILVATACAMPVLTGSAHAAFGMGIITAADWVKNNRRITLVQRVNPVTQPAASVPPSVNPPLLQSQEPPTLPTLVSIMDQPSSSTLVTGNSSVGSIAVNDLLPEQVSSTTPNTLAPPSGLPVAIDPPSGLSMSTSTDMGDSPNEPLVPVDLPLIEPMASTETPEPATLIVVLTGLGMVCWRRGCCPIRSKCNL